MWMVVVLCAGDARASFGAFFCGGTKFACTFIGKLLLKAKHMVVPTRFEPGGFANQMEEAIFGPEIIVPGTFDWAMRSYRPPAPAHEIHGQVDIMSEDMLRQARLVVDYSRLYPGHAFLTRAQVRDICRRYDLVFAPDFLFAGEIPEKNQAEIAAFRLHPEHSQFYLHHDQVMAAINGSPGGAYTLHLSGFVDMPKSLSGPCLIPFGSGLAIWSPNGMNKVLQFFRYFREMFDISLFISLFEDPGYNVVLKTDDGIVFVDPRWLLPVAYECRETTIPTWALPQMTAVRRAEWRFQATMPLHFTREYKRTEMARMVICPASMLFPDLSIRLSDGWEIEFGQRPFRASPGFDPIILQPVEGGYLVITKWDAEALIPEVAGQNN